MLTLLSYHVIFIGTLSVQEFFQETVPVGDPVLGGEEGAVPGAVVAIHSFGDFLGWHPHLHVLCSEGCFYGNGMFRVAPLFELKHLEEIFPAKDGIFDRHKVFKTLLSKGKITEDVVDMLMKWRHSGPPWCDFLNTPQAGLCIAQNSNSGNPFRLIGLGQGFNVFCGPRIQPGEEEAMASGS